MTKGNEVTLIPQLFSIITNLPLSEGSSRHIGRQVTQDNKASVFLHGAEAT